MQITRLLTSATLDALSGKPLGTVPDVLKNGSLVKVTYESVLNATRQPATAISAPSIEEEIVVGEVTMVERAPMKTRTTVLRAAASGAGTKSSAGTQETLNAAKDANDVFYSAPGQRIILNTFGTYPTGAQSLHRFTFEPA